MIDYNVPYDQIAPNTFVDLDGNRFIFDSSSKAEFKAPAERCISANRRIIDRRTFLAGRPLTLSEIRHGVKKVETRTLRERIADHNQEN